jgi:hypothetical protein
VKRLYTILKRTREKKGKKRKEKEKRKKAIEKIERERDE